MKQLSHVESRLKELLCCVATKKHFSLSLSLFLPLTHANIYSPSSSVAADRKESLHTCINTMVHGELCRTTVGSQTSSWPQECERNAHTPSQADRSEGLCRVTAVHSDHGLSGGWREKGVEEWEHNEEEDTCWEPAPSPKYWVMTMRCFWMIQGKIKFMLLKSMNGLMMLKYREKRW